jgi:hypothetical protein
MTDVNVGEDACARTHRRKTPSLGESRAAREFLGETMLIFEIVGAIGIFFLAALVTYKSDPYR